MRTELLTAPAHWSSYLINQDDTGLTAKEVQDVQQWLMENELDFPVSCEDAGFVRNHDASNYYDLACDCQTYTFLVFDGEQPIFFDARPLEEILEDSIPY